MLISPDKALAPKRHIKKRQRILKNTELAVKVLACVART